MIARLRGTLLERRPDVRQALEPVGRALTLPLAGSYWGEY